MVQLLADPTLSQTVNPALETAAARLHEGKTMSREEHAQKMRELNMKRGIMMRAPPRRGWSLTDYQGHHLYQYHNHHHHHHHHNDGPHHSHAATPQVDRIPENAALPFPSPSSASSSSSRQLAHRPKLPPPRRSHSVTDCEPEPPNQPRPSSRLTLVDLPPELHLAILDLLDPIDGVCLGLAHSRLYAAHRHRNGTAVPLSSRYSGPNDMEWAWRGAGPLVHPSSKPRQQQQQPQQQQQQSQETAATAAAAAFAADLDRLRVRGQMYCRKCGISRCELHRHLREWFGQGYEYCEIKEVFGRPAGPEAKPYCFMSSPKNPHRCGRHGAKRGTASASASASAAVVRQ